MINPLSDTFTMEKSEEETKHENEEYDFNNPNEMAEELDFYGEIVYGDEKEASFSIFKLTQYIKENKPPFKVLSSGFRPHIDELYIENNKDGGNGFLALTKRVITMYQWIRKKTSSKAIFLAIHNCLQEIKEEEAELSPEKFNENFKESMLYARDNWMAVDPKIISEFVTFYRLEELIDPEGFVKVINNLLSTSMLEAIKFISKLNLQKFFNLQDILTKLVNQDKINESLELVSECDTDIKFFFINLLTTNKNASRGADFVKKFGFNINQFPDLLERLEKSHVRYILKSTNYDSTIAEERLINKKRMLGFAVEDLFYGGYLDEACSISRRNNLLESNFITKEDIRKQMKEKLNNFIYIENSLFKKDKFGPTEVVVLGESQNKYILLENFGFKESDVIFISSDETIEFKMAAEDLLSSKIIGLDTEFIPTYTKFDVGGTALFQIASEVKAYLFDVLTLGKSKVFGDLLLSILTGPAIKVGHSIKSDFTSMRKNILLSGKHVAQNFFELQEIYQGFTKAPNIQGLATIAENLLEKKLSKHEQISNWGRRPLRKTQIHYAAMDAVICIRLFHILEKKTAIDKYRTSFELNFENIEEKIKKKEKNWEENELEKNSKTKQKTKGESNLTQIEKGKESSNAKIKPEANKENKKKEGFFVDEKYRYILEKRPLKFVVDNMLKSLASTLRNIGVDAEYLDSNVHEQLIEISKTEDRIIITRDKKFVARKHGMPTYFLQENDPEAQRDKIINYFKIEITQANLLTRCSKCNNDEIALISKEEAKAGGLNWRPDYYDKVKEIFQCTKCKQFYWEGNTWKNARKNYTDLAEKNEKKEKEPDPAVNLFE